MKNIKNVAAQTNWKVGNYTIDKYAELARNFHGYPAPGILIGGFMVEEAKRHLPKNILYDAISETSWCLPDAIQMLTPCKVGNGWLKIWDMGIYALSLYDKSNGYGIRVFLDVEKIKHWSEIKSWYLKLKPKPQQDSDLLYFQIREAGPQICSSEKIEVKKNLLQKRSKGKIAVCPLCGEAYPLSHGGTCKSCQGNSPYNRQHPQKKDHILYSDSVRAVPVEKAIGHKLLHDMTKIDPGRRKGAEFKAGQEITVGDVCRLQQMGRNRVYIDEEKGADPDWVHEDTVAEYFSQMMAGDGTIPEGKPSEGKINLKAERDGLLLVEEEALNHFNMLPGVMCACKHSDTVVTKDTRIAGTRAIPLYLDRNTFEASLALLENEPLFRVKPMRQAKVGIQITGTEVFKGLIKDKFGTIISCKVKKLGCEVRESIIVPDETKEIKKGIKDLIAKGCDLIITTAGLSVDPEDMTRQGIAEAGARDILYGAPILPGAMTLLARIDSVQIFGVPACALYFNTTSFDLILPRLLAGEEISRTDLAKMGHGGMCHECETCMYPKCPFGK